MQGDPIHALSALEARVRAASVRAHKLAARREQVQEDLLQVESEVAYLSETIERLAKVSELFRALLDLMVERQVRTVEGVVTQGLQTIFHDLDLHFEAEITTKYNRIACDFFIRQDGPFPVRGHPLRAFGGGPASVASLILKVLTVLRMKLWPFLALDESLVAVSEEYVQHTSQFLASLSSRMGMDLLLVTHNAAFADHAKRAYGSRELVGEDGSRQLAIRSLK